MIFANIGEFVGRINKSEETLRTSAAHFHKDLFYFYIGLKELEKSKSLMQRQKNLIKLHQRLFKSGLLYYLN